MTQPNPIDVVELAYRLDGTEHDWLHDVASAVYPLLDGGCGLVAYKFDLRDSVSKWLESGIAFDTDATAYRLMEIAMSSLFSTDDLHRAHVVPAPLETLGEALRVANVADPRESASFLAWFAHIGARDSYALRTIEPGGKGIVICAPQEHEQRHVNARLKRMWAKVSAHLAAGRRLRERLAGTTVDAVLTPSGKVEHAEGALKAKSAREHLRDAVLRQERARGRARREDPDGATAMWTALTAGEWSLVDQFERDGRRFIVARANPPDCNDPRALAPRERTVAHLAALGKSNKLIAYELGIAESTVASHLSAAMRKLGVGRRVELLGMLMRLATSS
jgi:DNA-binding CsgD family transcriptional regulator